MSVDSTRLQPPPRHAPSASPMIGTGIVYSFLSRLEISNMTSRADFRSFASLVLMMSRSPGPNDTGPVPRRIATRISSSQWTSSSAAPSSSMSCSPNRLRFSAQSSVIVATWPSFSTVTTWSYFFSYGYTVLAPCQGPVGRVGSAHHEVGSHASDDRRGPARDGRVVGGVREDVEGPLLHLGDDRLDRVRDRQAERDRAGDDRGLRAEVIGRVVRVVRVVRARVTVPLAVVEVGLHDGGAHDVRRDLRADPLQLQLEHLGQR